MVGFKLPSPGTVARDAMGDIEALVVMLNPANAVKLPQTWEAVRNSREAFSDKAVKRVNVVVLRYENDERWLISIGPKGGWKKIWNFGNGRN